LSGFFSSIICTNNKSSFLIETVGEGLKMDVKQKKPPKQPSRGISGSPKKGGGGGKGTWGKGGPDDLLVSPSLDENDPNYCSDEDNDGLVLQKVEVQSPFEAVVKDYLSSGDVQETAKVIKDLKLENTLQQFVKKAIVMSMEKGSYERESVSKLLSALYDSTIPPAKIVEGFQCVLDAIEDIVLDSPDATDLLSKFLARAIVDEVVPPVFLKHAVTESKLAKEAIALTNALVTEKYRLERLAHIWGAGDMASVKRLKEEARLVFEEYVTNGDAAEADAAVRKMNAPSFHFQLVKEAIRHALQKNDAERKRIFELLEYFFKTGLVSADHMKLGFRICYEMVDDLKLDVPNAASVLDNLTGVAKAHKWLPADFVPVKA
jgi:programmed cell death protein 4